MKETNSPSAICKIDVRQRFDLAVASFKVSEISRTRPRDVGPDLRLGFSLDSWRRTACALLTRSTEVRKALGRPFARNVRITRFNEFVIRNAMNK